MVKLINLVLLALFVWILIFLYQQYDSISVNIQNIYQKTQDLLFKFL